MKGLKGLRAMRRKALMTQEALAEKVGVTKQAVHYWEYCISDPAISTAYAIAEVLGCTVDDLYYGPKEDI